MGKVRVFSLAKQLGLRSEALVAALQELGIQNVTPATAVEESTANAAKELLAEQAKQAREVAEAEKAAEAAAAAAAAPAPTPVAAATPETTATSTRQTTSRTSETARRRSSTPTTTTTAPPVAPPPEVTSTRPETEASKAADTDTKEDRETERYFRRRGPSRLDEEDGLAELERQLAQIDAQEEADRARRARAGEVVPLPELARRPSGNRPEGAVDVPPVVTVLGHVDHGKTSLLDTIRKTEVAAGEHGGITQHIGASEVNVGDKSIVFIDTPGHEAFTAMRARGAMVTDVAILIVAANDGIMPQTVEAIKHVKAAKVPIIVAINKCDLPEANPERVKQQLLEHELVPEEWGGETICVNVSALTGEGVQDLLDMILLVAEVRQLWADPKAEFAGIVIESEMDGSQGAVATVLVRNGILKTGDVVVCGSAHGRIRRLRDWQGKTVKEMGPGRPVSVIGLSDVPEAGEVMTRAANPKEARQAAEQRGIVARAEGLSAGASLRNIYAEATGTGHASLNVIIKGDVWGSVQALEGKLRQLDQQLEELSIDIVATGVGNISESDIMLAKASGAIILAFQTEVDSSTQMAANNEGVEVRQYNVIYRALEDIQSALLGLLEPVFEDVLLGKAEVLQLFKISRLGVVAGSRLTDGKLERGCELRVTRDGKEIWRGNLTSLRHFDQDVRELSAPNECGVTTAAFRGWQVGDKMEGWTKVQTERTLVFREPEAAK